MQDLTLRQADHRLYRVTGEGSASSWTLIGAAWPNRDGADFSINCEAAPLRGRIVMRAITERKLPEAGNE